MAFTAKSAHLIDDMVLLSKITDDAIVDNLKKRIMEDLMFTYIGPVLIAVNPFKQLPYFDQNAIDSYQGVPQRENPPHVYGLTDNAYRDMLIDQEDHCVIISGESGAGKTVTAKYIMGYIAAVSGGGEAAQIVKDVILDSNPLLEAFGNAKTVRNNNSSRFGKYFEIQFSISGVPDGGRISNFLLEKSRVCNQNTEERNFHIFYQLLAGCDAAQRESFGLQDANYYNYLNTSGCTKVDGIDDVAEFNDTMHSMQTMGIQPDVQQTILQIAAALLHMGNITFEEDNSSKAYPTDDQFLSFPAYLLGVDENLLKEKITSREMTGIGRRGSVYNVTLNQEQATYTRDALVKAIYTRLFDFLVQSVNSAMQKDYDELAIGVLDIYGFEIFKKNGFEQFCINFVNEKLQQIFIELTLKAEQEEYDREGIQWKKIDFFNNKVVCDLIEEKRPPGIMAVLDDVCATMHAQGDGADDKFLQKAGGANLDPKHFRSGPGNFTITHYAGDVTYNVEGFCERNRDVLYKDLILLMQSSNVPFLVSLFPDDTNTDDRKRPVTFGNKIKTQCNELVSRLMKCQPHYIRCLKPNETKKPKDWDQARVEHQCKYLGLQENVRVRRAGFAYRHYFDKFLKRFAICCDATWPEWRGDKKEGCKTLLTSMNMEAGEWQLGVSKIFIKSPESLFLLEELRERNYSKYARVVQRQWRKYYQVREFIELKKKSNDIFVGKKERNRGSINRRFVGDCLGFRDNPALTQYLSKREVVSFACDVMKYDKGFKSFKRQLMLSEKAIYLVGREKAKEGPKKGQLVPVCTDNIGLNSIQSVSVSTLQDGFVVIQVPNEFGVVITTPLKTEFCVILNKLVEKAGKSLNLVFSDNIQYTCKKTLLDRSGMRTLAFKTGTNSGGLVESCKKHGAKGEVTVASGLPKDTKPTREGHVPAKRAAPAGGGPKGPRPPMASSGGGGPRPPMSGGGSRPPMGGGGPRPPMGGGAPRPPMGGGAPRPPMGGGGPPPPMGGGGPRPPMGGGGPRPPMGGGGPRPPMGGGGPRPPMGGGGPRPPMGGGGPRPPMGGGPRPPVGGGSRPPMGGGPRPPTGAGGPRPPMGGGGPRPSAGGPRPRPPGAGGPRPRPPVGAGGPRAGGPRPRPPGAGGPRPRPPTGAGGPRPRPPGAGGVRPGGPRPPMGAGARPPMGGAPRAPRPAAPAPAPAQPKKKTCETLFDYSANDTDELSFNLGDIITILDQSNDGWWEGELNGNTGLFPSNYVKEL